MTKGWITTPQIMEKVIKVHSNFYLNSLIFIEIVG